jgi:hypothetical protein
VLRRDDLEPEGGDPPCWAHLFEDEAVRAESPAEMGPGSAAAADVEGRGAEVAGGQHEVEDGEAPGATTDRR